MKAIFKKPVSNAVNYSREKELVGAYTVIGKINGEMHTIVTARAYMGRSRSGSTVYASIWVHGPSAETRTSGKGSAGGYGYHKESTAFAEAITSANIELWGSAYADIPRWDHEAAREYTPQEVRKIKKQQEKQRAYIDGCGDSSMRAAFEAIARATGARGKLLFVSH